MRHYRTEIVIPPDRTVVLQLPASLPDGPATVIVQVEVADDPDRAEGPEAGLELDREDIEWWEEFEEGADGEDGPREAEGLEPGEPAPPASRRGGAEDAATSLDPTPG